VKIIVTALSLCLLAANAQAQGAGAATGGTGGGGGTGGTAGGGANNAGMGLRSGTSNAVGTRSGTEQATGGVVNGNPAAVGRSSAHGMPPFMQQHNPTGATGINPYTGVPVGQPLHPNDLGSPESRR